jgi:hypothetical protein
MLEDTTAKQRANLEFTQNLMKQIPLPPSESLLHSLSEYFDLNYKIKREDCMQQERLCRICASAACSTPKYGAPTHLAKKCSVTCSVYDTAPDILLAISTKVGNDFEEAKKLVFTDVLYRLFCAFGIQDRVFHPSNPHSKPT